MNALLSKLNAMAPDKTRHFIAGSLAASAAVSLALAIADGITVFAPAAGVVAAALAGLWKELRDEADNAAAVAVGVLPPHEVSGADVVATIAGSLPVVLPPALALVWRAVHG